MALVRYKDLCIDAGDVAAMEGFWATTLGLRGEILPDGDSVLTGADAAQAIWVNLVPEAKTVKHRVHLDVLATSLEPFAGLRQLSADGEFPWTVFADPEGGEFCVFVRDEVPDYRLSEIIVDCSDPKQIATWWAEALDARVVHSERGFSWIDQIPGVSFDGMAFIPVPEPKTVKNRIHWDVTLNEGTGLEDLMAAGARVLRAEDDEIGWAIMADPEGNEFCVFAPN